MYYDNELFRGRFMTFLIFHLSIEKKQQLGDDDSMTDCIFHYSFIVHKKRQN